MKNLKTILCGSAAAVALFCACTGEQQVIALELTASGLNPAAFDTIINNDTVKLFTLKNAKGTMEVCITNYGGRVVSLSVPDKDGKLTDVVLGYDNIHEYADTKNTPSDYGSSVGRYANRIAGAKFTLNGQEYNLTANDGPNCLHGGGATGWMNKVYKAEQIGDNVLKLTIIAEDGENGFPGTVTATTTYTVTDDNTLDMVWEATTDKETIINQTNHNYYNLNGDFNNVGTDMELWINADNFTPSNELYIPTGEIKPVADTPFDFTKPHAIADAIGADFDQIKNARGGIDHNFCLNTYKDGKGDDTQACASLYSKKTGIFMEMFTNEPGVQCYTGNFQGVDGELEIAHKNGKYPQYVSVCLESQKYPNSPNQPEWVQPTLKPGEKYYSHAAYKFSVK
ncbi:MAG: galactose mutarotase [Bacteroidaceae bacterium]|nr:galactose mutarotase [Bacteroidaceae bacterium]